MALPGSSRDREHNKFVESPTRPGKSAIEIVGDISTSSGAFGIPSNSECYVFSTGFDSPYYFEQYQFYESGTPVAPVNLIKTIRIFYSDAKFKNEVGGAVV